MVRQRVEAVCRLCYSRCGIDLRLGEGKVIGQGYLCPKGQAIIEISCAPDRLQYPLRKEGDGWKRISWDEALEIIVEKLSEIRRKHGAQSVVIHMGHAGVAQNVRPLIGRFCSAFGALNFSSSGSHCHVARLMGNVLTYGYLPVPDCDKARCTMVWGANPAASDPLNARAITEAKEHGSKLVVVDPRRTSLAAKADVHVRIRPGTDGALALGMLNIVISEQLYDKEFVSRWTIGFEKLAGGVVAYPPEKVEKITWVPAETIRKVARLYSTTKPACISQGIALEHHTNAVQSIRAITTLQAITGNLDVPGGALMNHAASLADLGLCDGQPGEVRPVGAHEHPVYFEFRPEAQANMLPEAILTGMPYPIKAMIVAGSNPVLTFPNSQKTQQALSKLDFLVVMDLFMTETARLADMVLPAVTFLERIELCEYAGGLASRLVLLDKVLPEQGEGWSDWKFWTELGRRMGYEEHFPWITPEEIIDYQLGPLGATVETLRKEPNGIVYSRRQYRKYEKSGFNTPSGKVEIYSEKLREFGYDPLPIYDEPSESPVSQPGLAKEYPFVLTTGARILEYTHSRFRDIESLRKRVPEPWVEIHEDAARELGIENGEVVKVESPRGSIRVKAKLSRDIHPKVLEIPHGWTEANANMLTDDQSLDPISGFPPFRSLLCRVKKERNLSQK